MIPYYPAVQNMTVPRSKKPRQNRSKTNPSVSALAYRGPLGPLANEKVNNKPERIVVRLSATLQSSGTGTLTTVFSPASQVTSSPDWTNISALWDEYRILGCKIRFAPWNLNFGPTTNVLPPIYSVVDRQTATALSSMTDVVGYDSAEVHCLNEKFEVSWKMDGPDEASWVSTGTTPAAGSQVYIKLYGSAITNSINLLDYLAEYTVQVKGRK